MLKNVYIDIIVDHVLLSCIQLVQILLHYLQQRCE